MVNPKEYNATRINNALIRRISDFMFRCSWAFHPEFDRRNTESIRQYKDQYKGQRCFVLGNGPSLKKTDLLKLKGEVCLGANRIYLIKEQVDFTPTFLASVDGKLLEQFHDEISIQPMPKFINWKYYRYFQNSENVCFIKGSFKQKFSKDISRFCGAGHTVTFLNLQLAYYMGFTEVILIGCDHSYAETGVPSTDVKVTSIDQNHFSDKYYTKGHTFRIPDYMKQEYAYSLARKAFEQEGRRVVDATVDGKLQVFEKVDYENLFSKGVL